MPAARLPGRASVLLNTSAAFCSAAVYLNGSDPLRARKGRDGWGLKLPGAHKAPLTNGLEDSHSVLVLEKYSGQSTDSTPLFK